VYAQTHEQLEGTLGGTPGARRHHPDGIKVQRGDVKPDGRVSFSLGGKCRPLAVNV